MGNLISFLYLLILSSFPVATLSARICVFSLVGFMNYRSGFDTLLEALVDKGHELTVFTTLPLHIGEQYKTKIDHIHPKAVESHLEAFFAHVSPLEWRKKGKQHLFWDMLPILALDLCHILLQDKETQQWLSKVNRYDLFIVDSAWNECGVALSHVFHAKLVLFSFHSNLLSWNLEAFGSVSEFSWLPDTQYESTTPLSFLQKLHSTTRSIRWHIYRSSYTFYQVRKFVTEFLQRRDFPSIRELEQNASLVLVNSHFSEEYARSLPPVFVSVGGVHIRTEEQGTGFKKNQYQSALLKKVEHFLGSNSSAAAAAGFILVNIGCSNDTVNNFPPESLDAMLKAMNNFKHAVKFVFVWAGASKSGSGSFTCTDRVLKVEDCVPELSSLLAHPQIKGLISQGDLLDVQEAIFHAVPLILLPVVFEQDANAQRIERLGRGIRLEITSLKEQELTDAIHMLITNSAYKRNMKTASVSFQDRPVTPLESAVWWIEYTIRNPDMASIKPLGIQQTWYSRRLLDVWLFLFLCIIITAGFLLAVVLPATLFKSNIESKIFLQCECTAECRRRRVELKSSSRVKREEKKDC